MEKTTEPEQALLEAINDALRADTRVAIDDLDIGLGNGTIVLEGRVNDICTKRLAANRVRQLVNGRQSLVDRLNVQAQREGDLELRDEVQRNLSTEGMFSSFTLDIAAGSDRQRVHDGGPDAPRIEVHVKDTVVRLDGVVPSLSHRRFAEVLAWWAPGCERVDNRLRVEPPEDDNDSEITDAVLMVLEKDPLVHSSQLRPATAGGIVELFGLVGSEEERRLAVSDVWYVPGVSDVVDHIEVRPTSPRPGS